MITTQQHAKPTLGLSALPNTRTSISDKASHPDRHAATPVSLELLLLLLLRLCLAYHTIIILADVAHHNIYYDS